MGRAPCCDKANVKKGPWSPEEDSKLKEYIEKYGTGGNWIALPQKAGNKILTWTLLYNKNNIYLIFSLKVTLVYVCVCISYPCLIYMFFLFNQFG